MSKLCLILLVACFTSLVVGKVCKYDYQCYGKNVCVGGANACSGSRGLAVNDNQYYNTITYGSDCKASASVSNFTLQRLKSVNGSAPTTLYSKPSIGKETVLAELYNGAYVDFFSGNTHTLKSFSPGSQQFTNVNLQPNFQGYLEIDGRPSLAYSCAYDSGRYVLNTYGGLEEAVIFPSPTKTLYVYASGRTCGPSRLGVNGAIYLVSNTNNSSFISLGSISCTDCSSSGTTPTSSASPSPSSSASPSPTPTVDGSSTPTSTPTPTPTSNPCTTCNVPAPFYNARALITDFDVSGAYIFYGTATGLFRYTLSSGAVKKIFTGTVTGVDAGGAGSPGVGSSYVYFNTGTAINKIALDGTGLKKLNLVPTGVCGKY